MQYFLKDVHGADLATVRGLGLGHAFNGSVVTAEPLSNGPLNSGRGVYVSRSDLQIGGLPGYEWVPMGDRVLFGHKHGGPKDYARPSQLPGELVELGDGNQWLIPTAYEYYQPDGAGLIVSTRLPTAWDYRGGSWQPGEVIPQYAALWQTAVDVAGRYFGSQEGGQPVLVVDVLSLAAKAIEANYYLSAFECGVLGLLTNAPGLMDAIVRSVFGLAKLEALQKKT